MGRSGNDYSVDTFFFPQTTMNVTQSLINKAVASESDNEPRTLVHKIVQSKLPHSEKS
jgi:cytochrome P450